MLEYARLELRRNRLLFIGMTLTFIASLPGTVLVSNWSDYPAASGLNATLFFWTLAGLPLMAVLFGASSGAQLRSDAVHEAEALLPLSPGQRLFGAVLATGLRVLLLTVLVLLVSFIWSPTWREYLMEYVQFLERRPQEPEIFTSFWLVLTPISLVYTLLASFACAYALRQGIIGGFLGAFLGCLALAAWSLGLGLQSIFEFRAPFTLRAMATLLAALVGSIWALGRLAPLVERRMPWRWGKILALALALSAGGIGAAGAMLLTCQRLARSFQLSDGMWARVLQQDHYFDPPNTGEVRGGTFLGSFKGDLVWVTPEGRRSTLIPGERPIWRPEWPLPGVLSTYGDEDGSLWVLRWPTWENWDKNYELWHGVPGKDFALHSRFSSYETPRLARRGKELGLLTQDREWYSYRYAPIPPLGQAPQWISTFDAGMTARVEPGGRTLTQKRPGGKSRSWRLPGKPVMHDILGDRDYFPQLSSEEEVVFSIPIILPGDRSVATAVCRLDGSVKLERREGMISFPFFPERSSIGWGWKNWEGGSRVLRIVLADGTALPPVDLGPALKDISGINVSDRWNFRVLRVMEGKLWMAVPAGFIIQVDMRSGRLLKRWQLPEMARMRDGSHSGGIRAIEEGFFFHTGRELYFIRWDGSQTHLGAA